MDWPEELLEIFDDPLLADVRPKPKAPTPDDRLAQKLLEINKWVAEHGSEPTADGGLKEKLLAALRGGIKTVLIPEDNVKDLAEIPDNVKSVLDIVPVRWIDKVLEMALERLPTPLLDDEVASTGGLADTAVVGLSDHRPH